MKQEKSIFHSWFMSGHSKNVNILYVQMYFGNRVAEEERELLYFNWILHIMCICRLRFLVFLPCGAMGWTGIVALPGHTHSMFFKYIFCTFLDSRSILKALDVRPFFNMLKGLIKYIHG